MPISTGLYKKIYPWMIDEKQNQVVFRPFIANGNPYKSRVFLISALAQPKFEVSAGNEEIFAEALVSRSLFTSLYEEQLANASRELKGALQFENWLLEQGETMIHTSLNAYQVDGNDDVKLAKKQDAENYARGQEIFREVLKEFQPEIIVLQGTTMLTQFKTMFAENLIMYHPSITKVQLLEEEGPFAEMHYVNGKKALVFAARSMSFYGKDGANFAHLKKHIAKAL